FFSSRRRHTRSYGDWSSDVCSSDLAPLQNCADTLIADLKLGTISVQSEIPQILRHKFVADPWRAEEVRSALKAADRAAIHQQLRSEERRVGKECGSRGLREERVKRA